MMLTQIRDVVLIVIGVSLKVLIVGFTVIVMLPLTVGLALAGIALRRSVRDALAEMHRETRRGVVIEGEWVVVGLGGRDSGRPMGR